MSEPESRNLTVDEAEEIAAELADTSDPNGFSVFDILLRKYDEAQDDLLKYLEAMESFPEALRGGGWDLNDAISKIEDAGGTGGVDPDYDR